MEPLALECGIPAVDYWSMTLAEITGQVIANKKIRERELKDNAMLQYSQARLGVFSFNDPKHFPEFEKAYPFLQQEKKEQNPSEEMLSDQQILMKNAEAIKATKKRKEGGEE